jgi:hypothetical protein
MDAETGTITAMTSGDELRATILGVCDTPTHADELVERARQLLARAVPDSMVHVAVWDLTNAGLLVEHVGDDGRRRYQQRRLVNRTGAGTMDPMT